MTWNITFYTPILYQSYIVCKQWSYIRVSYSCKNCIHTPVCIMVNQLLHKLTNIKRFPLIHYQHYTCTGTYKRVEHNHTDWVRHPLSCIVQGFTLPKVLCFLFDRKIVILVLLDIVNLPVKQIYTNWV